MQSVNNRSIEVGDRGQIKCTAITFKEEEEERKTCRK